jgi:hypothetical protein
MDDMTQHPGDWFGQVVEITHNGEMAGGLKVRHPQFLRRRVDKDMVDADWRTR